MKRKEISTIFVVLSLICGIFLGPRAFAGSFPPLDSPASAVTVNVGKTVITSPPFNTSLNYPYPMVPSATFWVYVDVVNVTALTVYGVGFTFNQTFLQVLDVEDGGFLTSRGGTGLFINSSVIDNANGVVVTTGNALTNPDLAPTGSGHLLKVRFEVNPSLSSRGGPVTLMHFNTSAASLTQLTLTDSNGVDVTPLPQNIYDGTFTLGLPLSVGISSSAAALDVGQSALLTATVSGGISPFSYEWFLNGAKVPGATNSIWTFAPSVSGLYSIYANVTDFTLQRKKSNVVSINVHPALTVNISPSSATSFVGQPQPFSATPTGGTSPYSYRWYLNGSLAFGPTPMNTWTYTFTSTGTYQVYVKVTDGVNATAQSGNSQVKVYPKPLIVVSISQSVSTTDVGQSIFLNSTVTGGQAPYTYQWYVNGTALASTSAWTFTPTSAGVYEVFLGIRDSLGTTGTSSTIMLTANSLPTATVTPSSISLDIGESWTFAATVSNGTSPYSYQWYVDGSPVINATNSMWTFTPLIPAVHTVFVTVTDAIGIECTSNMVSLTANYGMTPSISPNSAVMDVGQSQQFTVSVTGGSTPYSYQWYQWSQSGAAPFPGATHNAFTFMPTILSTGFDIIYVQINDSLGTTVVCGATVIVNPPLTVVISPTGATIDGGQTQVFTSTTSNGTSPYTYNWYLDNISSGKGSTFPCSPAVGTHNIYLVVTDALGSNSTSNKVVLTVNPPPVILIMAPSTVTLDIGESWTFTSSTYNGTPPFSAYQWYMDGSPVVGQTGSAWTYTFYVPANHTIYITAMDHTGLVCTSNRVKIVVNAAMNPRMSPVSATIDLGQSQQFTVSVTGGSPPYSYQWYQWFPNQCKPFAGATSQTFTFTPTSSGLSIIYVEITDSLGIKVDLGATIRTNPPPTVTISPTGVMDVGQSQTLTATVSGGTQPFTYQWYLNGTTINGATNPTYAFKPSARGHYSFSVNITDGVGFKAHSNSAVVLVNLAPSVSISPTNAAIDVSQSQTFTAVAVKGSSPYSYQWYVDNILIAGATNEVWTYTAATSVSIGTHLVYVVVTDSVNFAVRSNNASLIVNPPPAVTISPISSVIDIGISQPYSSTATNGTKPYVTYQWYVDGNAVLGATTSTWTYTPNSSAVGTHIISLVITDSANFATHSNNATVTVNPALTIIISPAKAQTDLGKSVTLNSTVTGGMLPYSFKWYVNGVLNSTATRSLSIKPGVGTYTVLLVATDAFGLTASNSSSIIINPLPTVTLAPGAASILPGHNQTFTATAVNGTKPYTLYKWYVNGVLTVQTTVSTFMFNSSSTSTYTLYVVVTDAVGVNATSNTALINAYEISITSLSLANSAFYWSYSLYVKLTIVNLKAYATTSTVQIFANKTLIGEMLFSAPGQSAINLTVTAETLSLVRGAHYIISAYIVPVQGQVNTGNNYVTYPTAITLIDSPKTVPAHQHPGPN